MTSPYRPARDEDGQIDQLEHVRKSPDPNEVPILKCGGERWLIVQRDGAMFRFVMDTAETNVEASVHYVDVQRWINKIQVLVEEAESERLANLKKRSVDLNDRDIGPAEAEMIQRNRRRELLAIGGPASDWVRFPRGNDK